VANAALQPVIARANAALERGQAAATIELLAPLLRTPSSLSRDDELGIRVMLAESYLLQGDLAQAGTALGRSPDALRETLAPVLHSSLWRLHGRVAFARGEQSRAIALHQRALQGHGLILTTGNQLLIALQQQIHREKTPGPGGVTVETTSVRARLPNDPSRFGAFDKVSQTTYTSKDAGREVKSTETTVGRRDTNGQVVAQEGQSGTTVSTIPTKK